MYSVCDPHCTKHPDCGQNGNRQPRQYRSTTYVEPHKLNSDYLSRQPALRPSPNNLPEQLKSVVEYRKSGLSLNHIVGCPLDCGYCVRHLFGNFDMKRPHLVMDDERAVEELVQNSWFRRHTTPIQLFNKATDPFLPNVKEHLHRTLKLIDERRLTNPVLVITRWRIDESDVRRLEELSYLRLTVLVTWSGIDDKRIEPVNSQVAVDSLRHLKQGAVRTKRILYWRPVVAGLNDDDSYISRARKLASLADATVFTGLFHREAIRSYFRTIGVSDLYQVIARRKILPKEVEERIISGFGDAPLFRKTSCGVAYVHKLPDYNGHFGIEGICDICPRNQVDICEAAHRTPELGTVLELASTAGIQTDNLEIRNGRILVEGSTEQQRYFVQHKLGFQVHDREFPHFSGRHGRADEGWK